MASPIDGGAWVSKANPLKYMTDCEPGTREADVDF